eukprot:jgi/Mesvir1/18573/Mv17082-RA.1
MKFHFCGGHDVPDWLLAEIFTLSKISSVRIKLLSMQAINNITEGSFEPAALEKFAADCKMGVDDVRACMAALRFIVSNATKFGVDDTTLKRELMQLGLPREHGDMLCRPYKDHRERMADRLRGVSLKLSSLRVRDWYVEDLPGRGRAATTSGATGQEGPGGTAGAAVATNSDMDMEAASHGWVPGLVHLLLASSPGDCHDQGNSDTPRDSQGGTRKAGVSRPGQVEGARNAADAATANAASGAQACSERSERGKPEAGPAPLDAHRLRVGDGLLAVTVAEDKLRLLIQELKVAYKAMDG